MFPSVCMSSPSGVHHWDYRLLSSYVLYISDIYLFLLLPLLMYHGKIIGLWSVSSSRKSRWPWHHTSLLFKLVSNQISSRRPSDFAWLEPYLTTTRSIKTSVTLYSLRYQRHLNYLAMWSLYHITSKNMHRAPRLGIGEYTLLCINDIDGIAQ